MRKKIKIETHFLTDVDKELYDQFTRQLNYLDFSGQGEHTFESGSIKIAAKMVRLTHDFEENTVSRVVRILSVEKIVKSWIVIPTPDYIDMSGYKSELSELYSLLKARLNSSLINMEQSNPNRSYICKNQTEIWYSISKQDYENKELYINIHNITRTLKSWQVIPTTADLNMPVCTHELLELFEYLKDDLYKGALFPFNVGLRFLCENKTQIHYTITHRNYGARQLFLRILHITKPEKKITLKDVVDTIIFQSFKTSGWIITENEIKQLQQLVKEQDEK